MPLQFVRRAPAPRRCRRWPGRGPCPRGRTARSGGAAPPPGCRSPCPARSAASIRPRRCSAGGPRRPAARRAMHSAPDCAQGPPAAPGPPAQRPPRARRSPAPHPADCARHRQRPRPPAQGAAPRRPPANRSAPKAAGSSSPAVRTHGRGPPPPCAVVPHPACRRAAGRRSRSGWSAAFSARGSGRPQSGSGGRSAPVDAHSGTPRPAPPA